jgi:hypothetical protein
MTPARIPSRRGRRTRRRAPARLRARLRHRQHCPDLLERSLRVGGTEPDRAARHGARVEGPALRQEERSETPGGFSLARRPLEQAQEAPLRSVRPLELSQQRRGRERRGGVAGLGSQGSIIERKRSVGPARRRLDLPETHQCRRRCRIELDGATEGRRHLSRVAAAAREHFTPQRVEGGLFGIRHDGGIHRRQCASGFAQCDELQRVDA